MNTFQRYLAEEFAEDFQEGRLPRGEAIERIASVTGNAALAEAVLAASAAPTPRPQAPSAPLAGSLEEPPMRSATASAADPEVNGETVTFECEGAQVVGYVASPAGERAFPLILVCHENRGLTEHIRDVARRLARAGYVALAVDLLSRQGGTQAVGEANVPGVLANQPPEQFAADFRSGWRSPATWAGLIRPASAWSDSVSAAA